MIFDSERNSICYLNARLTRFNTGRLNVTILTSSYIEYIFVISRYSPSNLKR